MEFGLVIELRITDLTVLCPIDNIEIARFCRYGLLILLYAWTGL